MTRSLYAQGQLRRLLHPASIAVIGASARAGSFGNRTRANLRDFTGRIHLINERYREIDGEACHPSFGALPETPDCVVCATPFEAVVPVVRQCVEARVGGVVVYASGFAETGLTERIALQGELARLVRGTDTRLLGPNCAGTYNFLNGSHLTFGRIAGKALDASRRPTVGIVSQSGALGMSLAQATHHGVAVSHMLSAGNSADVGIADLVAYLAGDDRCDSIVCLFEGIAEPRALIEAAAAAARAGKPLVVLKSGRSEEGARAALSHTGSVAGAHSSWQAWCDRAGAVMVDDLDAAMETVLLLAKAGRPAAEGAVVVTTSGGAGVICADMADRHGVSLPQPGQATVEELRRLLPEFATMRNPCDITAQVLNGDAPMRNSALALLSDDRYAAAIVPHLLADDVGLERVRLWGEVAEQTGKVVAYVWCSEWLEGPGAVDVEALPRVALFRSGARCLRALAAWHRRERQRGFAFLQDRVAIDEHVRSDVVKRLAARDGESADQLARFAAKSYGLPIVEDVLLADRSACEAFVREQQHAAALKLESPDVPHKTDAGVVHLNLRTPDAVLAAYDDIVAKARAMPDVRIKGVLAQRMVKPGVELMIGARFEDGIGPVVVVGAGGIDVEVLADVQVAAAPVGRDQALDMIGRLRCSPLLRGHRGRAPVDLDLVVDAICRLSEMVTDQAGVVREVDINPLICSSESVVAVDVLMVLERVQTKEEP